MYTEERQSSGFGTAIFYILGAAACIGVGMLLAPQSGEETREQIKDWLRKRREQGRELGEEVSETVGGLRS